MPSAPAWAAAIAARTGSGWRPPRALRIVATWSMFTPRRRERFMLQAPACGAGRRKLHTVYRDAMTRQLAPTRPINRIDDRGCPKGRDDVGQMLDVLDVDVYQHLEEIGVAAGDLKVGDVPAVFADHGRECAEAAGLVGDDDTDA